MTEDTEGKKDEVSLSRLNSAGNLRVRCYGTTAAAALISAGSDCKL